MSTKWTYEIKIIEKPVATDGRQYPARDVALDCLTSVGGPFADSYVRELLEEGAPVEVELTAEEIIRFHHERRRRGCCPIIKWKEAGEDAPASDR